MKTNILLSVFLFFCANIMAQGSSNENQLLWEISGNGLKEKSYLYGSLHSNDKRLFRFSDSVYFALNHSKGIVLETDIFSLFKDWDTRRKEVKFMYDNTGKPYTASKTASKTIYGDENGMPQFVDAYFQEYCYNAKKNFSPLETVESQKDLAQEWSQPEFKGLGYNALNFTEEKLIDFYLKGDITSIDRLMRSNMSVYPGMYDDMIVYRNIDMVKGLDSLIKRESKFIAVGAGHLAGDQGIINLLRKKGYKLRVVKATYVGLDPEDKIEVKNKKEYTLVIDSLELIAIFPGKPMETIIWEEHPYFVYREMGQGNTYSIEIVEHDGELSIQDHAAIYIASPDASKYQYKIADNGVEYCEGVSDSYPEGLHWIRLIQSDTHLIIMKAYGGNKFMNSNRPNTFFGKVWFD